MIRRLEGSVVQGHFPYGLPRHRFPAAKGNGSAISLPLQATNFARAAMPGQRLPPAVQAKMESLFAARFDDVRVHVTPQTSALGTPAFTHGTNIYFAPGQYNPETHAGQQMLAHELAHVVQQRAGRARNPFGGGVALLHDRALEAEAQRFAARVPVRVVAPIQPRMATRGAVVQRITVTQPGYATGDMFGIAAMLIHNPAIHIVIARGPRVGRKYDMTDKADSIAAFYRESGIAATRIHVLDVPDVRKAGAAMQKEALRIERNILHNGKSVTQIKNNDIWPVGSGTTYVGKHFSGDFRAQLRHNWGVDVNLDSEIASWLRTKNVPVRGRRVLILWSRFSGKKGDIHLEHDSSYRGIAQIVLMAAPHYDVVILAGDPSAMPAKARKYDRIVAFVNHRVGGRKVFNLTGFWTEKSHLLRAWGGDTRTGQFRLYDYLNRHFDAARHLGFRSGNLEALALMGFTVRYMEEPHSEGSERMEKWHDAGGGRTSEGALAPGYERLGIDEPPTRSGKYLKDNPKWGARPIWAKGRQSIIDKPAEIKRYRSGFTERDLKAIRQYLQIPEPREIVLYSPSQAGVSSSDPRIRVAQNLALRLMNLQPGFALDDLNRRFRAIALRVHGDKSGEGDEKMKLLNWARDVLRGDFSQALTPQTYRALTW